MSTNQDLDHVKKQADFDRLLTAAHVHRRRGDYGEAERTIAQALELQPDLQVAAQNKALIE